MPAIYQYTLMGITYVFYTEAVPEFSVLATELDGEFSRKLGEAQRAYDAHNGIEGLQSYCVAFNDGRGAGCGALKRWGDGTYEVKRVYIREEFRRVGIGRGLVERLIQKARDLGALRLILETNRSFVPALALYGRLGFERIDNYGPYAGVPDSVCMAKTLVSGDRFLSAMKAQLDLSFRMIESGIESCPEGLWNAKAGGFVYWQQILHCLAGLLYWMRGEGAEFEEPFKEREAYPELEKDPVGSVSKSEMRELAERARETIAAFFAGKDDGWLLLPSPIYGKITNADTAFGQIRHVMYHVGHCDSARRERGLEAVAWEEYFG